MSKIRVSTEKYKEMYGRAPKGYGLWWFRIDTRLWATKLPMSFPDAKRAAITEAKASHSTTIEVLT